MSILLVVILFIGVNNGENKMKKISNIIFLSIIIIILVSCSKKTSELEQGFFEEYEINEYVVEVDILKDYEYNALNILELNSDKVFFTIDDNRNDMDKANILYSVNKEQEIKEALRLDESMIINSVVVTDNQIYFSAYEKSDSITGNSMYKVGIFKDGHIKELVVGQSNEAIYLPSLAIINEKVYTVLMNVGDVAEPDNSKRMAYLYNLTDEIVVDEIVEEDGINADYHNQKFTINENITHMNKHLIFSMLEDVNKDAYLSTVIYIYDGNKLESFVADNVNAHSYVSIHDELIYLSYDNTGTPAALSTKLMHASLDKDKEQREFENEYVILKKIMDYKDGAIVYAFDADNHSKQNIMTYYVTVDDTVNFEEINIFSYDYFEALPQGNVAMSDLNDGKIINETIKKK